MVDCVYDYNHQERFNKIYEEQILELLSQMKRVELLQMAKKCNIYNIQKKKNEDLVKELYQFLQILLTLFDEDTIYGYYEVGQKEIKFFNRKDLSNIQITKAIIMAIAECSDVFKQFYSSSLREEEFNKIFSGNITINEDSNGNVSVRFTDLYDYSLVELFFDFDREDNRVIIEYSCDIKIIVEEINNYSDNQSFIFHNIYNQKIFDLIKEIEDKEKRMEKDLKGWKKRIIKDVIKNLDTFSFEKYFLELQNEARK